MTPSGTTLSVESGPEQSRPNDLGVYFDLRVSSTGGDTRHVTVRVDEPAYVNAARAANNLPPLDAGGRASAAQVAAIRAVDENTEFFASTEPLQLALTYDELDESRVTDRISDQNLRRYIARRLYLIWQHKSFDHYLRFGSSDQALTGATPGAFLRNLQLLEQEGHVELERTAGGGFAGFEARATALLVREVEEHGAAEDDVESETDYTARLIVQAALAPEHDSIVDERRRYELAQTPQELASVFRAIVPILEGVVRRLLRAHGGERDYGTLGPMIGELRKRKIGTRGTWTQLTAVKTTGRDISLHGEELPVAVLRIVTVTCFELFPQLGLLFPVSSS